MYMDLTDCTVSVHSLILCVSEGTDVAQMGRGFKLCFVTDFSLMYMDLTHSTVSLHSIILCMFVGTDVAEMGTGFKLCVLLQNSF